MASYKFNELNPEIEHKVNTLLAQMTLDEKIGQMNQVNTGWRPAELDDAVRAGKVGSMLNNFNLPEINRLQRIAVDESRLGIPIIMGTDVIHGYRTIFPIPLAESCTWDPVLLEQASRVAADEAASCGTDWIFAPMVDIARDARWGRIAEGAGEDPCLGKAMAEARVRGFQSKGLAGGKKITACPKHYVAYGAAEAGKDYNTVDISERVLRNVYLPPFKAAFDAGAGTVMSSFNEISGIPASANAFILRQLLREEYDWPGIVLSDFDAIGELVQHGLAADLKEAALKAVLAGEDIDMMTGAFIEFLPELVEEGKVPVELIDEAVRRVLRIKFALGIFEQPYTDESLPEKTLLRPEHLDLALDVAQKSMVLLKNEQNLLPLSSDVKRIALIGPLADNQAELLGCWAMFGQPKDVDTVLDGFLNILPDADMLTYVKGCEIQGEDDLDIESAVTAALAADVAVVVVGEAAEMSGEAHSRAYLDLPGHQADLLEAVAATGTPVVLVVMSGRPLAIQDIEGHATSILSAWHGGVRAGQAVADLLFGKVNPSGRLTASWPRTIGQVPIYYAYKSTGRPVNERGVIQFNKFHKVQHIDETHTPLFGFGYGLSYTQFTYSDMIVETPELTIDGTLCVSATVTNTGDREGTEVVQLYVQDLVGEVTRPVKELKAFERLTLAAGVSKRVMFEVSVQDLGFHGIDLTYKVEPGKFKVWIGWNAEQGLEGAFEVIA